MMLLRHAFICEDDLLDEDFDPKDITYRCAECRFVVTEWYYRTHCQKGHLAYLRREFGVRR